MNRTAYANLTIVHLEFMMILGYFIDHICLKSINKEINFKEIKIFKANFISNNWNKIVGYIAVVINTCICVAAVSYIGIALQNRIDTSWKMQTLNDLYNDIEKDIPEDVVAFGQGVPEIMGGMNRKTNLYITDWSDMNKYSLNVAEEKISNSDSLFISKGIGIEEKLKLSEEFTCIKTYNLPGRGYIGDFLYQFGYYVKNVTGTKLFMDSLKDVRDTIATNVENVYNVSGDEFYDYWNRISQLYGEDKLDKCGEVYIDFLNNKKCSLSDREFVDSLYRVLLQREPHEGETDSTLGYMESLGSRAPLVGYFLASEEFINSIINSIQ